MTFYNKKGDPSSSAVFRLSCVPEFVGVLMPMRDDSGLPPAPAWVATLPVEDDLASMAKTAAASVPREGVAA